MLMEEAASRETLYKVDTITRRASVVHPVEVSLLTTLGQHVLPTTGRFNSCRRIVCLIGENYTRRKRIKVCSKVSRQSYEQETLPLLHESRILLRGYALFVKVDSIGKIRSIGKNTYSRRRFENIYIYVIRMVKIGFGLFFRIKIFR